MNLKNNSISEKSVYVNLKNDGKKIFDNFLETEKFYISLFNQFFNLFDDFIIYASKLNKFSSIVYSYDTMDNVVPLQKTKNFMSKNFFKKNLKISELVENFILEFSFSTFLENTYIYFKLMRLKKENFMKFYCFNSNSLNNAPKSIVFIGSSYKVLNNVKYKSKFFWEVNKRLNRCSIDFQESQKILLKTWKTGENILFWNPSKLSFYFTELGIFKGNSMMTQNRSIFNYAKICMFLGFNSNSTSSKENFLNKNDNFYLILRKFYKDSTLNLYLDNVVSRFDNLGSSNVKQNVFYTSFTKPFSWVAFNYDFKWFENYEYLFNFYFYITLSLTQSIGNPITLYFNKVGYRYINMYKNICLWENHYGYKTHGELEKAFKYKESSSTLKEYFILKHRKGVYNFIA